MGFGYGLFADDDTKEENGEFGEQIVRDKLNSEELSSLERYVFNDVYIEQNGYIYQIDHIFICEMGIFVLETKMVWGRIHGEADSFKWTSVYYGKRSFANPMKQNNIHVQVLRNILGDHFDYHSVIVFPRNNHLEAFPRNVINAKELANYILHYPIGNPLTHEEMIYIKSVLDRNELDKEALKQKHKKQIKKNKNQ